MRAFVRNSSRERGLMRPPPDTVVSLGTRVTPGLSIDQRGTGSTQKGPGFQRFPHGLTHICPGPRIGATSRSFHFAFARTPVLALIRSTRHPRKGEEVLLMRS